MSSINVFRCLNTICEMLKDRKKNAIEEKLRSYTVETIHAMMSRSTTLFLDIDLDLRIIFALTPKFKLADMKKYLEEDDFKQIILVTREKITSTNVKAIDGLKRNIQVFEMKDLMFNISHHQLVPKHELISAAENEEFIQQLVAKHSLKTRTQFPIILRTDPMAKYLDAKTGDIIKITRYSPTSGYHEIYRCCI
jgi:DNA-directed RNA polymerase subunit H (RpoH/RPB5)